MARGSKSPSYPWGTTPPRARLRAVSAKAAKALADARSPEFGRIGPRVIVSVQASRPLVAALQHLADAGLRATDSDEQPLPSEIVRDGAQRVDRAVNDLAASSALTLSERYAAFSEAVTALCDLSSECLRRGIARPPEEPADDGWAAFGC